MFYAIFNDTSLANSIYCAPFLAFISPWDTFLFSFNLIVNKNLSLDVIPPSIFLTVMPELFGEGGFNISQNKKDPAYAEYKALMDEALAQTDRAAQAAIWKKANQYALDQVWAIPTFFGRSQEFRGGNIGGGYLWYPFGSHDYDALYVIQ